MLNDLIFRQPSVKYLASIFVLGGIFLTIAGCDNSSSKVQIFDSTDSKTVAKDIPSGGADALQKWLGERAQPTEKGHLFKLSGPVTVYADDAATGNVNKHFKSSGEAVEISNFRSYVFSKGVDPASKLNGVTHLFGIKFLTDAARFQEKEGFSDWFATTRSHFLDPLLLLEKNGKWVVEVPRGTGSGTFSNQWEGIALIKPEK